MDFIRWGRQKMCLKYEKYSFRRLYQVKNILTIIVRVIQIEKQQSNLYTFSVELTKLDCNTHKHANKQTNKETNNLQKNYLLFT